MKKLVDLYKRVNKKYLALLIAIIIIIIALIVIIVNVVSKKSYSIVCSNVTNPIEGFNINETVKFKVKKNKINKIKLNKTITLSGTYIQYETYKTVVENHLETAYNYVSDDNKEINIDENEISIEATIKEKGIILNNMEVGLNDPTNPIDIYINTNNNLDSEDDNIYKINDKYSKEDLIKSVEGLGYTCK